MTKELSFQDIRRMAHHLGRWLEALDKGIGYHPKLAGRSKKLLAIAAALEVIGSTPNATINREALQAWRREIDEARSALKAATKEILNSKFEEGNDTFDDIPW